MTHLFAIFSIVLASWTSPLSTEQVQDFSKSNVNTENTPMALTRLAHYRSAREMEARGEVEQAIDMLQPFLSGSDALATAIQFHHARLLIAQGKKTQGPLLSLFRGPESVDIRWDIRRDEEAQALLHLADYRLKEGRKAAAKKLQNFISIEYPRHSTETPGLSLKEVGERAKNLARDMDYDGSLALYEKLLEKTKSASGADSFEAYKIEWQLGHLVGDKMRNDYPRVANIFRRLSNRKKASPEDLLYVAYALGKFDAAGAQDIYKEFLERYPTDSQSAEAAFFVAWGEFDEEMFPEAISGLSQFIDDYPKSGYASAARWYRAISHFRLKDYDAALTDFTGNSSRSRKKVKGRYWSARTLLKLNRQAEAEELLLGIVTLDPFSYYGILARELLPEEKRPAEYADSNIKIKSALSESGAAKVQKKLPKRARLLLDESYAVMQVGEIDLGVALLLDVEEKYLSARRYADFRNYLEESQGIVHRRIRSASAGQCRKTLRHDPAEPAIRACWDSLYPAPYASHIDAVRGELPRELFWSVMRQESFFLPTARSHADALGLMQLIPQVGGPAAQAYGVKFSPYELFRPETNLRFFAHAAKERYQSFRGHIPLVLMSYNSTPQKVWEWLEDNQDLPFDLFVEEIPWLETRNYVKNITAHLARYRTLNPQGEQSLSERAGLPYPESIISKAFADTVKALSERRVAKN